MMISVNHIAQVCLSAFQRHHFWRWRHVHWTLDAFWMLPSGYG